MPLLDVSGGESAQDRSAFRAEREAPVAWWRDSAVQLPIASGLCLLSGWALALFGAEVAALILHGFSLFLGAYTFVPGALRRLARGRLTVGLLMTIAAVGAVLLGHIAEAAALAFLFSLAEALEDRAMDRARHGLGALLDLLPRTARILRDGMERDVPIEEVLVGDELVVRPGDRVPTDGVLRQGSGGIDVSAITGESIPVAVAPGDTIAAGSINGGAVLRIEATAAGTHNSLTEIVELVTAAQERRGERARIADRIARPLVPAVLILSALVIVFGFIVGEPLFWTERALVVLVAASPCALAIAVPVTVISAIGAASKLGLIVTSGAAFERLGVVRRVVFDKTGTLTRNRPEVVRIESARTEEILPLAAALEAHSTHPLARSVIEAFEHAFEHSFSAPESRESAADAAERSRKAAPTLTVADVVEEPGHGIAGRVDGRSVRVGSARWLLGPEARRVDFSDAATRATASDLARGGMSVIVIEVDGLVAGILGIRDELRPEAAETVARLRGSGIEVALLTGDGEHTARALADEAGITDVRFQQLPVDKANAIEGFRRDAVTAMVGDGINDAPALATADVGIAMGETGSAAALESADVAFVGADLRQIPRALLHARRSVRIMTGNILLALAIIVVLVPLALGGVLGLAAVVLVHEVAEVLVILNGLRAARVRR
ncbi:cation-translocating P-type ATPase [Mycetocola tolaasinivorans]|uniref:Cation-translocating P-type ATPase n=1 Tax=Mycetocola tolaasinivorans TaxID=76635 RepID=A0A3L7AAU7_9MICO|nr:cation-translocating P-type ATPase [Mycetocola tolaasinivorans]